MLAQDLIVEPVQETQPEQTIDTGLRLFQYNGFDVAGSTPVDLYLWQPYFATVHAGSRGKGDFDLSAHAIGPSERVHDLGTDRDQICAGVDGEEHFFIVSQKRRHDQH